MKHIDNLSGSPCSAAEDEHTLNLHTRIRRLEAELAAAEKERDFLRALKTPSKSLFAWHTALKALTQELEMHPGESPIEKIRSLKSQLAAAQESDRQHKVWAHSVQQGFGIGRCPLCQSHPPEARSFRVFTASEFEDGMKAIKKAAAKASGAPSIIHAETSNGERINIFPLKKPPAKSEAVGAPRCEHTLWHGTSEGRFCDACGASLWWLRPDGTDPRKKPPAKEASP